MPLEASLKITFIFVYEIINFSKFHLGLNICLKFQQYDVATALFWQMFGISKSGRSRIFRNQRRSLKTSFIHCVVLNNLTISRVVLFPLVECP